MPFPIARLCSTSQCRRLPEALRELRCWISMRKRGCGCTGCPRRRKKIFCFVRKKSAKRRVGLGWPESVALNWTSLTANAKGERVRGAALLGQHPLEHRVHRGGATQLCDCSTASAALPAVTSYYLAPFTTLHPSPSSWLRHLRPSRRETRGGWTPPTATRHSWERCSANRWREETRRWSMGGYRD